MEKNKKLEVGQKVYYDGSGSKEFGIVIHSWFSHDIDAYDCYVVFFGSNFPDKVPDKIPYVLRYASTSLTEIHNTN